MSDGMRNGVAGRVGESQPRKYRPRAEQVGSLLRPAALKKVIAEVYTPGHTALLAEERAKDLSLLHAAEDDAIRDVVAKQIDIGLDVVSDGEFRRVLYLNSFYDALSGLRPVDEAVEFRRDSGEVLTYTGPPIIDSRLEKINDPGAQEARFLAQTTDHPFKVTFPAASYFVNPFIFPPHRIPSAYGSLEEFSEHGCAILRELIDETIAAGARYIQFDFPSYAPLLDEKTVAKARELGVNTDERVELALQADRQILENLPDDVHVGLHICRGNWRSMWLLQGSLEPLAERIFNELPYDSFLIEWEDVERQGDYSPLRHLPKGPTAVLGAISSKWPELESEDEIVRRLEEASRYVDMDQLAISTQCGFATTIEGNELDEEAQWRKLDLVVRVAERLWPSG